MMLFSAVMALSSVASSSTIQTPGDAMRFVYVDAGGRNTCGLVADGAAYCWGANDQGQLGIGRSSTRPIGLPARVETEERFTSLAVGGRFVCALTVDGEAWCWGENRDGQLGNGTTSPSLVPVAVAGPTRFASIVAARNHACGLTTQGQAFCWGTNTDAQIGDGKSWSRGSFHTEPVAVVGGIEFTAMADGGWDSSCGLARSSMVYCWGGVDLLEWRANPTSTPIVVSGDVEFWALAGGSDHLCGLSDDRTLCWGTNRSGQLGDGTNDRQTVPTAVAFDSTFIRVTAGAQHSCGLTVPGAAYCWGANQSGQLGNGTGSYANQGVNTPQLVVGDISFRVIVAGDNHTCGMTVEGAVFCWGENRSGQLGSASVGTGWSNVPAQVGP